MHNLEVEMGILDELEVYSMAMLLLSLVFKLVLLIFTIISILLIQSLLLRNIESKTHDFGILRMIGKSNSRILYLILTQSLWFIIIPALTIGAILSIPILSIMYSNVFSETDVFSRLPSLSAMTYCLAFGLLIPLISSLYPLYLVSKQDLNEALNY